MRAVNGEKIHRAAAVGAELAENEPSVRFKKADVAVRELGAPPEVRRAALFDPRRERIVRYFEVKEAEKRKAKIALSVADAGIVW